SGPGSRRREQREGPRELRIWRRQRLDAAAIAGVLEREPTRVQQHAVDAHRAEGAVVAAVAVAGVADEMVEGVLEVAADLAEAAGARRGAQPRVARGVEALGRDRQLAGGEHFEVGDRWLLLQLAGAAIEGMVDGEARFGRPAAADRPIILSEAFGHQRLAERRGGLAI